MCSHTHEYHRAHIKVLAPFNKWVWEQASLPTEPSCQPTDIIEDPLSARNCLSC